MAAPCLFAGQVKSTIWIQFVLLFCIFFTSSKVMCVEEEETTPRIGIIGAGLGGTSSAFFLRNLFGEKALVDIYEAERVGGRTAVINIGGLNYEAGGAIIHNINRYMVKFAQDFGKEQLKSSMGVLGFYGQDDIIFQTSNWLPVTLAKLVWRYGTNMYNIKNWNRDKLFPKFNRIYEFQDQGMAFTTVEDLLSAMGEEILNMTKYSIKDVLLEAGFSETFIDEFGMAAMRTNYGQTTDVHGFVGAVSMAGAEPGLWSVEDGNKEIAVNLLAKSKANLIEAKVTSVALIKDDFSEKVSYEVEYEQSGKTNSREYDILIIAAPLEGSKSKISFLDFPVEVVPFSQQYHKLVAMFVEGRINKTTFGLNDVNNFPEELFTTKEDTFFNSIGKLDSVDPKAQREKTLQPDFHVWKTFLNKAPSEEQVGMLFDKYDDLRFVDWMAYPDYKPNMDLPSFILYDNLYYVNAIESAASAMEMSVIGAKNVALLAFNQWHQHFDKINEHNLPENSPNGEKKSEL